MSTAPATLSDAARKVTAARTAMVLDAPFWGTLALRLQVVEDAGCGTAWTDGTRMGYDPRFVEGLRADELRGLIAHEVAHCALGHPWRREAREMRRWNVAADYAINAMLTEAGFKLPPRGLLDAKWRGMSSEQIYARLPVGDGAQQGQGGASGTGGTGGTGGELVPGTGACDVRDAPSSAASGTGQAPQQAPSAPQQGNGAQGAGSAPPDAMTAEDWRQAVVIAGKVAGKGAGNAARDLGALAKPRVPWRELLRAWLQASAKDDYTWRRPNARHIARGLYLPARWSEAMGPIAVIVDTSGSIDAVTLAAFGAEIASIHEELAPEATHVLYADTRVARHDTFARGEACDALHPCGGGGTDFGPALAACEETEPRPVVAVYLTDLEGPFPERAPAMPVLWAVTGRCGVDAAARVPFGDTVEVDV